MTGTFWRHEATPEPFNDRKYVVQQTTVVGSTEGLYRRRAGAFRYLSANAALEEPL